MFSWWKRRSLLVGYVYYWLQRVKQRSSLSPFVQQLYDQVIYKTAAHPDFLAIERYRQILLVSQRTIITTELGAGSSVQSTRIRSVNSIAQYSLSSPKFGKFLYRLVQSLKPATIIEFGTSLGVTTLYLSLANENGKVYTLEGCPVTAQIAKEGFHQFNRDINIIVGDIDNTLPKLLQEVPSVDLAYVDANHRKEATLRYFEQLLSKTHEDSVLILDDIYWSFDMMKAWQIIRNHPRVTLSLDLFDAGLVFFHPNKAKQHYALNF